MPNQESLDMLRRWGDTLERAIVDEEHSQNEEWATLLLVLYPYAGIWYKHILPRRDHYDLSRLDASHDDWRRFAADHYTAIVRFYQAYRHLVNLKDACAEAAEGELGADILLKAHDASSSFWEHIGSAIDNLGRCFDDIPGNVFSPRDGLQLLKNGFPNLSFAYDRRTQMIHHSIVPLGIDDGMLVFNERHFDSDRTEWTQTRYSPEMVDEFYIQEWRKIASDLSAAWYRLRDILSREDSKPPQIPEELRDPVSCIQDGRLHGSGLAPIAQSQSTRVKKGEESTIPYWVRAMDVPPSGY